MHVLVIQGERLVCGAAAQHGGTDVDRVILSPPHNHNIMQ